jgi:hypothetical protein
MSWTAAIYQQHVDRAAADALLNPLGVTMPEDPLSDYGDENHALVVFGPPWITEPVWGWENDGPVLITPGERETGFWTMVMINESWAGAEAALAAINGSDTVREYQAGYPVFASR